MGIQYEKEYIETRRVNYVPLSSLSFQSENEYSYSSNGEANNFENMSFSYIQKNHIFNTSEFEDL